MVDTTPAAAPGQPGADLAREQAAGLRRLAAMLEAHPELAEHVRYMLSHLHQPLTSYDEDPRGVLTSFHTAALAADATPTVDNRPDRCKVTATFGPVVVQMWATAEVMAGRAPAPTYAPLALESGGER